MRSARAIVAVGSFVGGTLAVIGVMMFSSLLAKKDKEHYYMHVLLPGGAESLGQTVLELLAEVPDKELRKQLERPIENYRASLAIAAPGGLLEALKGASKGPPGSST